MVAHGRGSCDVASARRHSQAARRVTYSIHLRNHRCHAPVYRLSERLFRSFHMPLSRRLLAVVTTASVLALAGCQTAPPPVIPAAFTPLGVSRALSVGGRDRRLALARGEDARRQDSPAQPGHGGCLYGRSRQRAAPANGRHRARRAAGRRRIVIRIPAALTFDAGSAGVKPQFDATLLEIARTVKTRNQTFVDVLAHTDTTGTPQVNQALSRKARRGGGDLSRRPRRRQGAHRLARSMAKARRSTCPTTPRPRRRAIAGSRSGWCPTAASAASAKKPRSRSAASASPIPPSTSGR